MLEQAGDALLVLDATGTIVIAGPPAAALLRRPADRLPGAALPSLVDEPHRQPLEQALAAVARSGRARVDIGVDGEALVAALHAAPSSPPTIVVSLERRGATRESHQERVMREFLRNAAHQLRTPLAGIAAAVETLQAGAKERPADRDRFLEHLADHADRLTRIARGLLLLARAEAGELLNVAVVSLAPMLAEIAAQADRRDGVTVTAECPPELAAVATRDLLRETVAALVDNATAYTETGSILIRAAKAGAMTEITVSDTGPGIPVELHERIFEPFFRAGDGADGFGLGLAIAAQAVAAMHGEIAVSSTPGVGTTFTVTLPAATVEP